MIISHKHKFIFIKTKKTAGTSIEIALSSICGENDIVTPISPNDEVVRRNLGFRTAQNYLIPLKKYSAKDYIEFIKTRKRKMFYNHISASEIKSNIDEKTWNTYYKFAFDRNPFDKMVSLFYWRKTDKEYKTIGEFLKSGALSRIKGYDIYSINKLVAVDKVYKYEDLNEALIDISKNIGLPNMLKMPDYKAKSGTRKVKNYKDIIDKEAVDIIKIAFAREIELLNYKY